MWRKSFDLSFLIAIVFVFSFSQTSSAQLNINLNGAEVTSATTSVTATSKKKKKKKKKKPAPKKPTTQKPTTQKPDTTQNQGPKQETPPVTQEPKKDEVKQETPPVAQEPKKDEVKQEPKKDPKKDNSNVDPSKIVKINSPNDKISESFPDIEKDNVAAKDLDICTFNIQFLGTYKNRDNHALADFMKQSNCDMVVVQELVAPPDLATLKNGTEIAEGSVFAFPDGTPINPVDVNTDFFLEMQKAGYDRFWLSEEDTGTAETNQNNASSTEWYVVFYKSWLVRPKLDLPHGFLAADRTKHESFDRVPYAFAFETRDKSFDFVLINVHLHPGGPKKDRERRKVELTAIYNWIDSQNKTENQTERDFIILGDMNIEDTEELHDVLMLDYKSLNIDALIMTNTNIMNPAPYDHIMLSPLFTTEIKVENNFQVLSLHEGMRPYWIAKNPTLDPKDYPGNEEKYKFPGRKGPDGKFVEYSGHDTFRMTYSDHQPVKFRANLPERDDD